MNSEISFRILETKIFSRRAQAQQEWSGLPVQPPPCAGAREASCTPKRPHWITWASGCLWAALVGIGIGCGDGGQRKSGRPMLELAALVPVGHLEWTVGDVTLERAKRATPAELGYLFDKDILLALVGGQAKARFPGNRVLSLAPSTRALIGEDKGGPLIRLYHGSLQVESAAGAAAADPWGERGAQSLMGIQTPYGVARIKPGESAVSVTLSDDSGKIEMLKGTAEVVSRKGEAISLRAGQTRELGH